MPSNPGRRVGPPTIPQEPSARSVSTPPFQQTFPVLWEFLAVQRDLGEMHKTGSVTLFVDGDKIKLCVNDRPRRHSCFVSGDTLLEALARVDRGLKEGSLNWSSVGYKRRSAKKVNKPTPMLNI